MEEQVGPAIRERVWVEKVDKSGPEPVVVERLFVENGVVQTRERPEDDRAVATFNASRHPANREHRWSPLNRPPRILSASEGLLAPSDRKKVLIYGCGEGQAGAPLDDPDWEVWALNLICPRDREGRVRADRWFDVHQRVAQTPDDLRWIAALPVPIYVPTDLLGHGPTCVRLPHERLETAFGVTFWSCTFAYQIALAMLENFTDIAIHGVELSLGNFRERSVEASCVNYWIGQADARGVRVHVPDGSRLGSHRFRYGLEYDEEIADVNAYVRRTMPGAADEIVRTLKEEDFADVEVPARPAPQSVGG